MSSPLHSPFTIQDLTGPISEKLPHASTASKCMELMSRSKCSKSPSFATDPHIFSLGCSLIALSTPSIWGWPDTQRGSGALAGSRFQEGIRVSGSLLLPDGANLLIRGASCITKKRELRVLCYQWSLLTIELEPQGWAMHRLSPASLPPTPQNNQCHRTHTPQGAPAHKHRQFLCPPSSNSYLVIPEGKTFPSFSLPSLYSISKYPSPNHIWSI